MDDALAAISQTLVGEAGDEARRFCPERRGQHLARALAGDLGQRIEDRSGLVKLGDRGIVLHGVSLLREVLAGFSTRHDTPPSQAPSPIFSYSSTADFAIVFCSIAGHYASRRLVHLCPSARTVELEAEGAGHGLCLIEISGAIRQFIRARSTIQFLKAPLTAASDVGASGCTM